MEIKMLNYTKSLTLNAFANCRRIQRISSGGGWGSSFVAVSGFDCFAFELEKMQLV
jgi:hypothetical protein